MQEQVENRSAGRETPDRPLIPCTVCQREIPRRALTCLYCGHPTPASRIRRTARKRRNPAKSTLAVLIMLAGLVSFVHIPSPMNVVVGVIALILGVATARAWQCNRCGARVDRQSAVCPRCALPFVK